MVVALVQMTADASKARTSRRRWRASAKPPRPARTWSRCKSCSPVSIPARARTMPLRRGRADSRPDQRSAIAKRRGGTGVVVVGSLFERRAAGLYHNTAVVFDADGSLAGMYRKMHIPDDPLYYEKFYFTPGDLGFRSFPRRVRPRRRLRLLGPVVSRGRAADGAGRRADHFLSHGHRLAARRESRSMARASTRPGKR